MFIDLSIAKFGGYYLIATVERKESSHMGWTEKVQTVLEGKLYIVLVLCWRTRSLPFEATQQENI